MGEKSFDLLVIGGGINGCGVARDAAGRELSVLLVEKDDLAQATSSASTNCPWRLALSGHFHFRMVREALQERETSRMMPHISGRCALSCRSRRGCAMRVTARHLAGCWPIFRPCRQTAGLADADGLFVYDHLGGRKILPACRSLDLRAHPAGAPLQDRFVKGFEYSDCWVEDSFLSC